MIHATTVIPSARTRPDSFAHMGRPRSEYPMRKTNYQQVVPSSYAKPLLQELMRLECDVDGIWQAARISLSPSGLLRNTAAAMPLAEFTRFYRLSVGALERRCCERDGRRPQGKALVDMMCYALISCPTLEAAMRRAIQFNAALGDSGGELSLIRRRGEASFTMNAFRKERDSAALLVDLTGLNLYYQLFSWLIGRPISPVEVGLAYSAPTAAVPLFNAFSMPLTFGQSHNYLRFPERFLHHKLVRSNAELERTIDYLSFNLGFSDNLDQPLAGQIRLLLSDALQQHGRILDASAVADLFHISTASLRRKLSLENTSFMELRTHCQRDAAEYLLMHTEMPIADIAQKVGLGSDRAFRRVFRQWTGQVPSAYRSADSGSPADKPTR